MQTLGDVLNNLRKGTYAISVDEADEGTILAVDDDGWVFIIYPHRKYKRYGINIMIADDINTVRWLLKDMDDEVAQLVDSLEFVEEVVVQ